MVHLGGIRHPALPTMPTSFHLFPPCLLCSYELPWEDKSFEYPASLAPPLQILIDASNGAFSCRLEQCHAMGQHTGERRACQC